VKGLPTRPYAAPAAFLLAATLAVVPLRAWVHNAPEAPVKAKKAPAAAAKTHVRPAAAKRPPARRLYTVKAGDTLAAIAGRIDVPVGKLLELNPTVEPTSLFIGQRLRVG
jgi:LysM repeat protein